MSAVDQENPLSTCSLLDDDDDDDDALYCREDEFEEHFGAGMPFLQQDLFWDDEELQSLLVKETESCLKSSGSIVCSRSLARKEAVEWILQATGCHGFSASTAVLAVGYLDRFLSSLSSQLIKDDKPWMMQLVAVTCLSLAAKVEETSVPLLLDLQLEGSKCFFDAKTIQKMELLVLSTLQWRMNCVTSLSFLDHIIRRLAIKNSLINLWEFLSNCEKILLSVISDSRILRHLPSVIATATILYAVHKLGSFNHSVNIDCLGMAGNHHLLGLLRVSKEAVDNCHELISDILSGSNGETCHKKRRIGENWSSMRPSGVDVNDIANDSREVAPCVSSSVCKKTKRVEEQHMKLASLKHHYSLYCFNSI